MKKERPPFEEKILKWRSYFNFDEFLRKLVSTDIDLISEGYSKAVKRRERNASVVSNILPKMVFE